MRCHRMCITTLLILLCGLAVNIVRAADVPPVVQDIVFHGIEHVSAEITAQLDTLVPKAQIGQPFDDVALRVEGLALLDTGWYASVITSTEPVAGGLRLVFTCKENPTVLQVDFDGLKTLTAAQQQLVTSVGKSLQNLPLNKKATSAAQEQLQQLGVFRECTSTTTRLKDGILLVFSVVETPLISAITFEGNTRLTSDELTQAVNLHSVRSLDHTAIEKATLAIEAAYARKGYTMTHVTGVSHSDDNVVHITITEAKIGTITFDGNVQTPEDTLRKTLTFTEGDFFNQNTLTESVQKLDALGLFQDVQATPQPGKEQGSVDVLIKVQEKPREKVPDKPQVKAPEKAPEKPQPQPVPDIL